jgi:hypothetical protein
MKAIVTCASLLMTGLAMAADLPPPEATEAWSPVPPIVTPGAHDGAAPSDAVVLFDGKSLNGWESVKGGPAKWTAANGVLTVVPETGDIQTTQKFGDVQLHIEWRTPVLPPDKKGQDRGNSGVYLQGLYEVQVLDSLENRTYSNGQAGAIYKQSVPLVNPARPAGQWQSYDIVFIAPRFKADGSLKSPARMTVFFNGVLVQYDFKLKGPTVYQGQPTYKAHGDAPLLLQEHHHAVSYRNVWVRKLDANEEVRK